MLLRQLLNHSRDGVAEVTYHASKTAVEDEGGLYAPPWSLQNLPKRIRSSLVHDIAFDLEIVNSQPTILLGLMRKFGYPENKMHSLCDYINCREELLSLVDSDRSTAKQKVLNAFYGGARDDVPEFCKSLAREVDAIADTLKVAWCRDYPTYREREKHGVLAIILRDVEKSCLFAMEKVLRGHGRQFMTYIHDGGLVRKLDNEKMFPQQLLDECEACVREMGYELRLQVKPLEASYQYIRREREDKFLLDGNGCLVAPLTDLLTAEYFLHKYGQTNFVSVQHTLYMFDKQTGMWTSNEVVIRRAITNADIVLKTPTQEGPGVNHFISANVKSTELLLKKLVDIAPLDDSMRNQVLDKTKEAKREPILIQTVTLTNTNKRDVAPGLVLEMIGYDDLELVSFRVGSSGWAKNSIVLREYGNLVVTNEFSIPPGKTVTLNVKYNVRNCPASTDLNFYAQVMIPTGGDVCYKYTPMPVGGVGWGLRGGTRGTVHLSCLFYLFANCAACYRQTQSLPFPFLFPPKTHPATLKSLSSASISARMPVYTFVCSVIRTASSIHTCMHGPPVAASPLPLVPLPWLRRCTHTYPRRS